MQDTRSIQSKEQLFEYIRSHSKNGTARVTHSSVNGKEIILAHIIGTSSPDIYHNLGLDIGFHAGADLGKSSIGIIRVSPPESVLITSDIAVKMGDVDLGFMDRFSGAMFITGPRADVTVAIEECVRYFKEELHYTVCPITTR